MKKLRALVIDDSRVMRNMVMEALRRSQLAEFEFTEAEDGAVALAKFDPKTTDIVFADWNMPNMTGIEFVRTVRSTYKSARIPIVMVTSEKTLSKIDEALNNAGANAYITKPFTVDELKNKLGKLIESLGSPAIPAVKAAGFFSKLS
jgi:two-component system chemotaxis response regulator CheY